MPAFGDVEVPDTYETGLSISKSEHRKRFSHLIKSEGQHLITSLADVDEARDEIPTLEASGLQKLDQDHDCKHSTTDAPVAAVHPTSSRMHSEIVLL